MTHTRDQGDSLERGGFLLFLAAVSILFVWVSWPFATPILWAALAAIVFRPLYRSVYGALGDRGNLAATLTLLIIFVAVLLPGFWIGSMVVDEAIGMVNRLQENPIDIALWFDQVFAMLPASIQQIAIEEGLTNVSVLQAQLEKLIGESAGLIAQEAVAIGGGAVSFVLSFGVALYIIFFFLRDGARIGEAIIHSAPIERAIGDRLSARFLGIVRATIKGSGIVGLVQGTLGAIAFAIVGLPSPLLFGVLMAILSLLPVVGTVVVWGPAAIWLLVSGQIWQGLFMLGAGTVIIGMADNVLRPILVGRDTGIPDWLILITTLGGIALVGFSGIVLGPLVAGLFLASWSILREQRAETEKAANRYRTRVGVDGKVRDDSMGDGAKDAHRDHDAGPA